MGERMSLGKNIAKAEEVNDISVVGILSVYLSVKTKLPTMLPSIKNSAVYIPSCRISSTGQ